MATSAHGPSPGLERDSAAYPEHLRSAVERYLESLRFSHESASAGLEEAMRYSLLAGGKRIRRVLALATACAIRRDPGWVLPLAALSASRRLRIASVALGVYLIIAWAPASGQLWNAISFHPEKTPLGRLHQRSVKELLN